MEENIIRLFTVGKDGSIVTACQADDIERYAPEDCDGIIAPFWFFTQKTHLAIVITSPTDSRKFLKYRKPTDYTTVFGDDQIRIFLDKKKAEFRILKQD